MAIMGIALVGVFAFGFDICGVKTLLKGETNPSDDSDACNLSSVEQRRRQSELMKKFAPRLKDRKEINNGYAYIFSLQNTNVGELEELVKNEQECCPFLTFKIDSESHPNEIWLEVSGKKDVKEFLKTFFTM
jgi:hypothetical protein